MISSLANTVKYFDPQIDLTLSPCHRKMTDTEILIHLLTPKNYTSIISKIIVASMLIFASAACLSPVGLGLLAIKATLVFSPSMFLTVPYIILIVLSIPVPYAFIGLAIQSSYSRLQVEKKVMKMLDGQVKFDELSNITTRDVSAIPTIEQNRPNDQLTFQSKDLLGRGIIVGVDNFNRSVVCMHVKSKKHGSLPFAITILRSTGKGYWTSEFDDERWMLNHKLKGIFKPEPDSRSVYKFFNDPRFNGYLSDIYKICVGIHPEYQLLKNTFLVPSNRLSDIDIIFS